MFLNKYIDRYSYNILGILGWIELVFFLIATYPEAYEYFFLGKGDRIFAIVVVSCFLMLINIIVLVILSAIIFFEKKKAWRIKNQFWINSKLIKVFLHLGFFFWLCPFLYLIFDIIFN